MSSENILKGFQVQLTRSLKPVSCISTASARRSTWHFWHDGVG